MTTVSIIIPIYELDAYLFQCVSSAITQTYQDLNIILVDDGSTDKAQEICHYFLNIDKRIELITKKNGGLVSARKAGIEAARGEYIFYLDGDDWIDPSCIETYVDRITIDKSDIVLGGYKRDILGKSVVMTNLIPSSLYNRQQLEEQVLPGMICQKETLEPGLRTYSWGKLYKRELIFDLQTSIPDSVILGEDAALLYPAINNARSVSVCDFALCNYRQRANSILKALNVVDWRIEELRHLILFMVEQLAEKSDRYNYISQLRAYFCSLVIFRCGGFLSSYIEYCKYSIFGTIGKGSRVAIYNSGSFGVSVYSHAVAGHFVDVGGWYDPDYKENRILGLPVQDPLSLGDEDFDCLLVPTFDPAVVEQAQYFCEIKGLSREKVRTPFVNEDNQAEIITGLGFDPYTFKPL